MDRYSTGYALLLGLFVWHMPIRGFKYPFFAPDTGLCDSGLITQSIVWASMQYSTQT
jgi:hypothetical protein